jgi:hypothetical protein
MDLTEALKITIEDTHNSFTWMNAANVAAHVRHVLCLCCLDGDSTDTNRLAYEAILKADEGDLALVVSELVGAELDEQDIRQLTDGSATIDGMPALEWLDSMFGEEDPE